MIPFIQRVTSWSSPFEPRLGGAQLGREQRRMTSTGSAAT